MGKRKAGGSIPSTKRNLFYSGREIAKKPAINRCHPGIDAHPGDFIRLPDGKVMQISCVLHACDAIARESRYYVKGHPEKDFFWGDEITVVCKGDDIDCIRRRKRRRKR